MKGKYKGPRKRTEIEKISSAANDKIAKLVDLTQEGKNEAALELVRTTKFATSLLEWLCDMKPEMFVDIAAEHFSWPVLYDPHRDGMKENADYIRKLGLGTRTQINLSSGKTFSRNVPANNVALHLHAMARTLTRAPRIEWESRDWLRFGPVFRSTNSYIFGDGRWGALEAWGQTGAGRDLPKLSKTSALQWAKAGAQLLPLVYGKNFEEHRDLLTLKRAVLLRAKDGSGKAGGRGVVRKAMLQAVKQAWSSIAALD